MYGSCASRRMTWLGCAASSVILRAPLFRHSARSAEPTGTYFGDSVDDGAAGDAPVTTVPVLTIVFVDGL